jgi:Arc/MetJ family transcription regulator
MAAVKTHLDLDEHLLTEAMRRGAHTTKRAAVNAALADYINLRKRHELLALRGQVHWEGDLDQMRKSRVP